jgi:hypothetical protein
MEGIQAGGLTYRTRKEYATVRRPQNKKIIWPLVSKKPV